MNGFQCVADIMTHWTDEMGYPMPKGPTLYARKSAPTDTAPVCLICGRELVDGDNVMPLVAIEVSGMSYACIVCESCVEVFDDRYIQVIIGGGGDAWGDTGMVM